MNKKLIFVVLAVMVTLMPMGTTYAQGEQPPRPWTNSSTEIRSDIGVLDPNLVPGVDGYKVFKPGAITTLAIKTDQALQSLALTSGNRYAATDAFKYGCPPSGYYCGGGDHDSQSPLFEDQIWVDGCIKRDGNSTWANCNANHTAGSIAHTDTSMSGGFLYVFRAKSWHHFHKSGYIDWNPTTEDTAS